MKLIDIDIESLPNQTESTAVQGRVLIYDADSLCYKSAATAKKLPTAVNRFKQGVLEMLYLTEAETGLIHLTHKTSDKAGRGRIKGVKEYQANRTGSKRPNLLHHLRDAVVLPENILPEYSAKLHFQLEADDACMIDSYALKDNGVLVSEDKDLRQTPYPFYDTYLGKIVKAKGIGSLWKHVTPAGNESVHGIGRIFFWAQMLMGDNADNIQGILEFQGQRCGATRTYEALMPFFEDISEDAIANFVIDGFRVIDQNPWPEAYLLHMMRDWGDSFYHVVQEVTWSKENDLFLKDCLQREWFIKEVKDDVEEV